MSILSFTSLKNALALHRIFRLRQRYLLTRGNKFRLRYAVPCYALIGIVLVSSGMSAAQRSGEGFSSGWTQASIERQTFDSAMLEPAAGDEDGSTLSQDISEAVQSHISEGMRQAAMAIRKAPESPSSQQLEVGAGDTLAGVLEEAGLSGDDAYKAVQALSTHYDPRKIKAGQLIDVHFTPGEDDHPRQFASLTMKIDPVKEVTVAREDEAFVSGVKEKPLVKKAYAGYANIETSLYGSAARAGIPSQVIAEVIRVYSWDIDFQRDIRQGDRIEVMYEAEETEDGEFAKYGHVLYANLSVGGKKVPIYRYEMEDGRIDYFQPDGHSIRKTLMKTPIDGARISSGFGMRRHPILGYNKMHKGMDFAAPTGTPIYAAGDGVVEFAGRQSGYGNYIRLRHNSTLKTAYAHMHRFAKGMNKGKRVEQGDIIGYVGTTGRSTGPHLHYEVLVNSKQVNPNSVDLPTGEQLAGSDMKKFKSLVSDIHDQYVSLTEGMKFAQNLWRDKTPNRIN